MRARKLEHVATTEELKEIKITGVQMEQQTCYKLQMTMQFGGLGSPMTATDMTLKKNISRRKPKNISNPFLMLRLQ